MFLQKKGGGGVVKRKTAERKDRWESREKCGKRVEDGKVGGEESLEWSEQRQDRRVEAPVTRAMGGFWWEIECVHVQESSKGSFWRAIQSSTRRRTPDFWSRIAKRPCKEGSQPHIRKWFGTKPTRYGKLTKSKKLGQSAPSEIIDKIGSWKSCLWYSHILRKVITQIACFNTSVSLCQDESRGFRNGDTFAERESFETRGQALSPPRLAHISATTQSPDTCNFLSRLKLLSVVSWRPTRRTGVRGNPSTTSLLRQQTSYLMPTTKPSMQKLLDYYNIPRRDRHSPSCVSRHSCHNSNIWVAEGGHLANFDMKLPAKYTDCCIYISWNKHHLLSAKSSQLSNISNHQATGWE